MNIHLLRERRLVIGDVKKVCGMELGWVWKGVCGNVMLGANEWYVMMGNRNGSMIQ